VFVRPWFSVLSVVVLVLGMPTGWSAATPTALAQDIGSGSAPRAADDVALGVIVDTTSPRSMELAREAGFTHAKMIVQWARLEPRRGRYTFAQSPENDLDNLMDAAGEQGLKLVLRVDGAPEWAGGKPSRADPDVVEAFYAAMAAHARGTVVAYEVLNEPNLPFEWGGPPDPSRYAAFLKAASRGARMGDPSALVLGGGLSPATGGAGGTMEDVDFLRGMYVAGIKGAMDALAIHNYGGNHEPERDPGDCGICFRRAEIYRQVMLDAGDSATPVWSTELGWLLDPGRNMGQYDWMRVSADKQAEYIVRAYRYALKTWPWMTGLVLSNLDASTSPYHTGPRDGLPWFAILNKDHSPRPAWKAFKAWRDQERALAAASPRAGGAQAVQSPPQPPQSSQQPPAPVLPAADPSPGTSGATAATAQPPVGDQSASEAAARLAAAPTATPIPESSPSSAAGSASPAPPPGPATPARLRVAKTDGTGVNLRSRPSSAAPALAVLLEDTTVELIGEDVQAEGRAWRRVRTVGSTADGVSGWVAAQYLVP
jgi:hypothetical protein